MKYTYNKQMVKQQSKFAITAIVAVAAVMMSANMLGGTHAKELASGAPAPKPACADVKSLSYRGDARVGETGLSSIDVDYSVSPCDKTIPVRVDVKMFESATNEVVYTDTDAAFSGKFTVFGVKVRTSYQVVVTVVNATTGATISSQRIFAAAIPKGV